MDMCYNEPMKVKLITVGKLKEKYLKDGIAEFSADIKIPCKPMIGVIGVGIF